MDSEWLNRLGILLNFIAGFLLAPQLIGVARIHRIENALERALGAAQHRVDALRRRTKGRFVPFVFLVTTVGAVALGAAATDTFLSFHVPEVAGVVSRMVAIVIVVTVLAATAIVLTERIAGRLVRSLDGDDRLSSYLVGLGIVTFVSGNLFQFVATF
jgi:hypothetical protein